MKKKKKKKKNREKCTQKEWQVLKKGVQKIDEKTEVEKWKSS